MSSPTKTRIVIQGFDQDGEWSITELTLLEATLDLHPEDGERLSIEPREDHVHVTLQSLSRSHLVVRPVSTNSVDLIEFKRR